MRTSLCAALVLTLVGPGRLPALAAGEPTLYPVDVVQVERDRATGRAVTHPARRLLVFPGILSYLEDDRRIAVNGGDATGPRFGVQTAVELELVPVEGGKFDVVVRVQHAHSFPVEGQRRRPERLTSVRETIPGVRVGDTVRVELQPERGRTYAFELTLRKPQ